MGSADLISRNLRNRVEVVFPVRDPDVRQQVMDFMKIQFQPAVKTQHLDAALEPIPWGDGLTLYCVQESFDEYFKKKR